MELLSEVYINVITLNCWGIPFISKNRKERMGAIATHLSKGLHDIVSLQEIWDEKDFFEIRAKVIDVLPYSHYFYSGVLGSGVCVFSRWPIEEVFFHAWPLNGYVHMIHHGDWFGGKGIGLCRIKYNDLNINLYSAHLHAEYCTEDIYLAHRILQAFNTAEFIKLTSSGADVSILAGDLNVQPHDLAYKIICETGILTDSCVSSLANASEESLKCHKWGTNERAGNSYTDPAEGTRLPEGKRIDYILYNSGNQYSADVVDYGLPLPDEVPGQKFSYSDHEAVAAKLSIKKIPSENNQQSPEKYINTLEDSIKVCKDALSALQYSARKYLIYASSIFLLLLSTVGMAERTVVDIPRLLLVGVLLYCLFMGTLWNRMESNSVLAGQRGMEIIHNTVSQRLDSQPKISAIEI